MLTLLNALESDKTMVQMNDGRYQLLKPLNSNGVEIPKGFDESIVEIFLDYADGLPDRLRGKYLEFSGAFNLFNWDDWLANQAYEAIRRAAFIYTPEVLEKPGTFLDGGCGMGIGTSAIWLYYYKEGHVHPNSKLQIHAIDYNTDFIRIGTEEFDRIAAHHKILSREEIMEYKTLFPKFQFGSISEIPYEDEFFDYVYISQVLHWTDPKKAIKEVYRVLRPGGIFFGTNVFIPRVNPYLSVLIRVFEGAYGSFKKEDMTQWLTDAGFSKIKYTTPVTVFRAEKL